MTICVAVAVYDGIVFATDSASSVIQTDASGRSSISNVYMNGNKLFNLVRKRPVVSMTCGMGNFGHAPISALTKDLRKFFDDEKSKYFLDSDNYTVKEVTEKTRDFFEDRYRKIDPPPANPHSFEYWIGGYSSNSETHELWFFQIVNGTCSEVTPRLLDGKCGVFWSGQPEAINRLLIGFSPKLGELLLNLGVGESQVVAFLAQAQSELSAPLFQNVMPIQDAIEFAEFLVDTTKQYFRFLPGADVVGGETDIASVTRHERFKWIKRKHYYDPALNPRETDHV